MNATFTVALFLVMSYAGAPEAVIADFPVNELPAVDKTENVEMSLDQAVTKDGNGSLKIIFAGNDPCEVLPFAAKLDGIENTTLWFEVDMRWENLKATAYATQWVTMPDGNSYFSRGLDQTLSGTGDWRRCRIPFYLEKGQRPERVTMGVRFEGPGTVWLDNARLVRGGGASLGRPSRANLLGALIGALGGLWGVSAGILSPRGKGKWFVLGFGLCLLLIAVLGLGAGLVLMAAGHPQAAWFDLVFMGVMGVVIFGLLLPVVMKRYSAFEAQRLAAMDMSDSL